MRSTSRLVRIAFAAFAIAIASCNSTPDAPADGGGTALWTLGPEIAAESLPTWSVAWTDPEKATAGSGSVAFVVGDRRLLGRVVRRETLPDRAFFVSGTLVDGGTWSLLREGTRLAGGIATNDGTTAEIRPGPPGAATIVVAGRDDAIDCPVRGRPEAKSMRAPGAAPDGLAGDCATPEPPAREIEVVVLPVITKAAREMLGSAPGVTSDALATMFRQKILEASSQSFATVPRVRLVVLPVVWADAGESADLEGTLERAQAAAKRVASRVRDEPSRHLVADVCCALVASFLYKGASAAGLSAMPTSIGEIRSDSAFGAFPLSLVSAKYVFAGNAPAVQNLVAHELGHLFGAGHEVEMGAGLLVGSHARTATVGQWAHGTVMSIGAAIRHPEFSLCGEVRPEGAGSPCGPLEDNAGTIRRTAPLVEALR